MSGEALYERYKDALRRGHVASLRGRLEEALTAYAEAAAIAPERATPHTSAGTALMRRKRPADAVRHYATAIRLAPHDEAALLGRAQALTAMGRRPQAADAYDAAADTLAANGKLADAVDASRRGLELAEGRERRRTLEQLIERLRASEPAEPGRVALERALVVLEGRAVEPRRPSAATAATKSATAKSAASHVEPQPVKRHKSAPVVDAARQVETPAEAEAGGEVEAREAVEVMAGAEAAAIELPAGGASAEAPIAGDAPSADPAPVEGAAEPDDAEVRGEPEPVPPRAARSTATCHPTRPRGAHARGGGDTRAPRAGRRTRGAARPRDRLPPRRPCRGRARHLLPRAVDRAGRPQPSHLALVELYDERGWSTLATEKLDLLDRLAALDADESHAALLAGTRGTRGQGGPPARS